MEKYTILLVEDEDIIRKGLRIIIQEFDIPIGEIYEAGNGQEAEEICLRYQPNIIITDIVMPEKSGLDFIAKIKQKQQVSQPEILIISGYDEFKYAQTAMQLEVSNYLLKPVKKELLYEALQKMISRVKQRRIIEKKKLPIIDSVDARVADDEVADGLIAYALKYINENISQQLDLETVSKKLLINSNYFSHLFKKKTGINFVIYLQKTRIEHAKKLLKNPLLRVYQIAEMSGYSNEKYFCKVFRKHTNYTPGQYRKEVLRNNDN